MKLRGLYLVTPDYYDGNFYEIVEDALNNGVDILQYRDKTNSLETRIEVAGNLLKITRKHDVPLIIDDDIRVVKAVNADGLHLGKDDMPVSEARKQLKNKIIGASAYGSIDLAQNLEKQGADYVAFGAFFETQSKKNAEVCDMHILEKAREGLRVPIFAIGGINESNVGQLLEYDIDGVAVISAIFAAENPGEAAKSLKRILSERIKL